MLPVVGVMVDVMQPGQGKAVRVASITVKLAGVMGIFSLRKFAGIVIEELFFGDTTDQEAGFQNVFFVLVERLKERFDFGC